MSDSNKNNDYEIKQMEPAYNMTNSNTNNEYEKKEMTPTNDKSEFYEPHYVPTHSESDKLSGADAGCIGCCAECLICGLNGIILTCISSIFCCGSSE
ncbi:hypothetical protein CONCODRAFT_79954 [Conidiobolus coronatus NRRL 28638]|uniref:Uncharacterized protein n=1 Tax=Conidiobolus coronatus (strain ATCC 28846 / CBS 209.66 / NRRL 28638) TaxID=796925 RepID=A0A137NYK6_CONC2|nr:hypothetical protein CONCODRAFT_79954 [Conidiobolus coronatus NRRL 28638]|eukprot:KXN67933.1 hypothetical protein CONCODRAFT_79954 [Conidiobolus coronatus NRRL 28638]